MDLLDRINLRPLFEKAISIHQKLTAAGFTQDRFGQYKLETEDGTKITFYKGAGWEVDVILPDGSSLSEEDIDAKTLLESYTEIQFQNQ